jgi:uncharacterized cofD-like protein
MSTVRIAGIGGGTGLPLVLQGLAELEEIGEAPELCLTGIVCVSDNGGSSGRLREAYDIPALGDLRNCLLGLRPRAPLWRQLFEHRFASGDGLAGHALGNLILTALAQQAGSLRKAIDTVAGAMQICGTVLPATEVPVTLCAEGTDGRLARGECAIAAARMAIERVWLEPRAPRPARGVLEAIGAADVIVLGPGSLFSSVVPPLLVSGVADAIRGSRALRVYVCNLMAEPGETDGFTAADHVRTVQRYLGPTAIDVAIVNTQPPRMHVARRYLAAGAGPVDADAAAIRAMGVQPLEADLLNEEGPCARHDPRALGRLVLDLAGARRRRHRRRQDLGALCVESSAT